MKNIEQVKTSSWLENDNPEIIVSRRPMTQRLLFGAVAAALAWFVCYGVHKTLMTGDISAAWPEAAMLLLLGPFTFMFLHGAGPRRICLNIRERNYSFQQGFPLWSWTSKGQTSGGELSVTRTRSGQFQVRFRAPGWRYGLPIAYFAADAEARDKAWQIAGKLDLSVTRRDAVSIRR